MTAGQTLILLAAACCALAQPVAAQDSLMTIRGRVLGPDNAALAGQPVVLHRVQSAAGATIAEAVTTADGVFELRAPVETDTTAIYFVAARYAGELYIGAPFRAGQAQDQVIQVGVAGTSANELIGNGTVAMPQPLGRAVTSRNWLLLLIPLAGVAAVAIYALIPRGRIPHNRALLIRIAELDEGMDSARAEQRAALLEERARLATQLRAG